MARVHDSVPIDELAMDHCLATINGRDDEAWLTRERIARRIGFENAMIAIKRTFEVCTMIGLRPKEE